MLLYQNILYNHIYQQMLFCCDISFIELTYFLV